jgi:cyclopropane fatty-acyl-phospholipid synthase-like methyltransferase
MPASLPLAEQFANLNVIGIDWAVDDILQAYPDLETRLAATGRVKVISGDFFSFECIPRFDVAVDLGTFHHIAPCDWETYVDNLASLLRNDGHFFLETFHPDDKNWGSENPGGHVRKDYYCHYHNAESLEPIFGHVFASIREVGRWSHWEHVISLYHLTRA